MSSSRRVPYGRRSSSDTAAPTLEQRAKSFGKHSASSDAPRVLIGSALASRGLNLHEPRVRLPHGFRTIESPHDWGTNGVK